MQDYKDIMTELCEIIKPFAPAGQRIEENTDLVNDLDLDSMTVLKLVLAVEDGFDISVPLNTLPRVRTVQDFALQIQQLIRDGS